LTADALDRIVGSTDDARWAEIANAEAERFEKVLASELLNVNHIGSTAVPNLRAKPTIDPMPVVGNLSALDLQSDRIRSLQ